MNVDFNNLRLGIQSNFNAIMAMLKECCHDGEINMEFDHVLDLESELDDLRDSLATLMCLYTDDSTNISDQADLSLVELTEA